MSVTAAKGFRATGGSMGIKPTGKSDVAIVTTASGKPVAVAGTFTTNKAAAAPVQVTKRHLEATGHQATTVILTSGNANAATGAEGVAHAMELCATVARALDVPPTSVLICQTGLIGIPFPLEATIGGLAPVLQTLGNDEDAGTRAAEAIMTTDTFDKQATVKGSNFTVGAMAKGAAMLAPNMATMLCCITTDADVAQVDLERILRRAVEQSFNRLLTDGAVSTNDTVLLLASGEAGHVDLHEFEQAVTSVCLDMAEKMAEDAEGATKVIHLIVKGAASDEEAHAAARNVADSLLVKCSFNGEDPYWGRVVSELATAGVAFDIDRVSVAYGGTVVCEAGIAKTHDVEVVKAHMAQRHVTLECNLNLGIGSATMLTVDLGHGYIDENRTTS